MGEPLVVPYVGTWIEMKIELTDDQKKKSRSLRGNVDRNTGFTCSHNGERMGRSLRGNVDRNFDFINALVRSGESFPTWERG